VVVAAVGEELERDAVPVVALDLEAEIVEEIADFSRILR
jgi:hypothetical protein